MIQQKILFTAAGVGDMIKTKLYQLVPIVDDSRSSTSVPYYHDITQPLHGAVASKTVTGLTLGEALGKNVVVPVIFRSNGQTIEIPEAVVSVTKKKNIVSTSVVGGNGTVKEFISDEDMEIAIVVGIVAVDLTNTILDEYPAESMSKLMEILDSKKAIEVWSPFLELFDLDGGELKIVVTDYSVEQSTHTNRQVVNIKAVSDYDYMILHEEL